jgi:flagellar biosynthesis protein FliP
MRNMARPLQQISSAFFRNTPVKILASLSILLLPTLLFAAEGPTLPTLSLSMGVDQASPQKVSVLLEILFLLTVLSLAPAIVLTVTSFTRIIVVFSFLRHAMGTQQMPPNQVLASLAIFLTIVIMLPLGTRINQEALQPYLSEEIGYQEAMERAEVPLREFLFKHTREKDLSIFFSITGQERPRTKEDVPTSLLIPAFMISELKTGFQIGFLIYIPFLILDMVVASILLAMGMMMLPPVMISMPFKILLFVMVDGWNLLVGSLVNSFA